MLQLHKHMFALGCLIVVAVAPTQSDQPKKPEPSRTDCYGDALPLGAITRLGTVRFRHSNTVSCFVFSNDGKLLVSGGEDQTIRVWDVASGRELQRCSGNQGHVHSLSLTPDTKTIVSGGDDGTVRLWDLGSGQEIRRLTGHQGAVFCVAVAPDGSCIASGGKDQIIRLWGLPHGQPMGRLVGHEYHIGTVTFSPDSKTLASCGRGVNLPKAEYGIRLWDVATRKQVGQLIGHKQGIKTISFCRGGTMLASISDPAAYTDPTLRIWDIARRSEIRHWETKDTSERFSALACCPDGKLLAIVGLDGHEPADTGLGIAVHKLVLWEMVSGKQIHQFGTSRHGPCLAFAPDGKTLAETTQDRAIELWEVGTGRTLHNLAGHGSCVRGVAFSPDGKIVASAGYDETLRIWQADTGREVGVLRGHRYELLGLAFSPDGKTVATGGADHTLRLWDVAAAKEAAVDLQSREVTGMAFSPDGKVLISVGTNNSIFIRDMTTGRTRQLHADASICTITWSPDGRLVALGCTDGVIRLLQWETSEEVLQLKGHRDRVLSADFSPDGRTLASGGVDGTMRLWEMATHKERYRIDHRKGVDSVAFSPKGRLLASASSDRNDRAIRLWDLSGVREPIQMPGHQAGVNSVAFSPDGSKLASASNDTTILIWDIGSLSKASPTGARPLSSQQLQASWLALADEDAGKAYAAIQAFSRDPVAATAFLRDRLMSQKPPDPTHIAQLIHSLEDERFAVRKNAQDELEKLSEWVELALRKTLAGRPSLELRQRGEAILKKLEARPFTAQRLQLLRAIETLEGIGTQEARRTLETLAAIRMPHEAKPSLERLGKRSASRP